jgi:uncharacterized membrane protein
MAVKPSRLATAVQEAGRAIAIVGGSAVICAVIPIWLGSYPQFFSCIVFGMGGALTAFCVWGLIRDRENNGRPTE